VAEKLAIVHRLRRPPGLLLDVGCAAGEFLDGARSQGWDVEGIEYDPQTAERTRRERSIPVRAGAIEEVALPDGVSVCTFWASLEHLTEPLLALRRVREVLIPGGCAIVLVPNFASWEARLGGEYWPHLDVPRHLYHYEPDTLRRLLEAAGFQAVDVTTPSTHLSVSHWLRVMTRGRTFPAALERALGLGFWPLEALLCSLAARAGRNHSLLAVGKTEAPSQ